MMKSREGKMMNTALHSVPAGGLRSGRRVRGAGVWMALCLCLVGQPGVLAAEYFPPKESQGGWRKLTSDSKIRDLAGMDPVKLRELKTWLRNSDGRNFAAVVIRRGYIVLEVTSETPVTDTGNIKSCAKAICATVMAIASELGQTNPLQVNHVMKFSDEAFNYIPWAFPLSDSRKSKITVRQLLNHTSGITPESRRVTNKVSWDIVLGYEGSSLNQRLAFNPGTNLDYTTHAFYHAALVLENVTGQRYDRFTIDHLLKPLGIETWQFTVKTGSIGTHADHGMGLPAREMARIAYCMLRGGKWKGTQVIPRWFVTETGSPTQRFNPEHTHGWQLPGQVDSRIPSDARSKGGSGGQLIAFVPSKDLVIVRHTGGSGRWGTAGFPSRYYYDYLAKAVEAVRP